MKLASKLTSKSLISLIFVVRDSHARALAWVASYIKRIRSCEEISLISQSIREFPRIVYFIVQDAAVIKRVERDSKLFI